MKINNDTFEQNLWSPVYFDPYKILAAISWFQLRMAQQTLHSGIFPCIWVSERYETQKRHVTGDAPTKVGLGPASDPKVPKVNISCW